MITGNHKKKIRMYVSSDNMSIGIFPNSDEDEEFIGVPYSYVSDNSIAFIEVCRKGICIATINAHDVAEIDYQIDIPAPKKFDDDPITKNMNVYDFVKN